MIKENEYTKNKLVRDKKLHNNVKIVKDKPYNKQRCF